MKKFSFSILFLISLTLLTAVLFYWVKWQTRIQPRVVSCEINSTTCKIGEAITFETKLNIPVHCKTELKAFELREGLKEHDSGITFKQLTPNSLLMKESLFSIEKGEYKNLIRKLRIYTPKGVETLKITYPTFTVSKRIFDSSAEVKFYGEVTLSSQTSTTLSVEVTLAIIVTSSLIVCLIFLKSLPGKVPSPIQLFRDQLQLFADYQEAPDSQPLMRLQDQIRSLLAFKIDEGFRSNPLHELNWDKLSETETKLLKPLLEKIHNCRFTGAKIAKEEFHKDIKILIEWADAMIMEDSK